MICKFGMKVRVTPSGVK